MALNDAKIEQGLIPLAEETKAQLLAGLHRQAADLLGNTMLVDLCQWLEEALKKQVVSKWQCMLLVQSHRSSMYIDRTPPRAWAAKTKVNLVARQ